MTIFSAISLIITLSALLSYINNKWLKLPSTIGVMTLSILIGITLKLTEQFYPEQIAPIRENLSSFNFSSFVLDIVLCFLLFAGSLHVNWSDLKENKSYSYFICDNRNASIHPYAWFSCKMDTDRHWI
jgi:CPA1 family monovalent cation:H+ antiporter